MERKSEPTTPLRSASDTRVSATYSAPIRLPKNDLSDLLPWKETPKNISKPARRRSRPLTPHTLNALNKSPYVSPRRTPTRRRRRSSGRILYDENYIGPVTIEYLRFFTRKSVAEQNKNTVLTTDTPQKTNYNYENDSKSTPNDFDFSLVLPKTDLDSPPQFKEIQDEEINPFIQQREQREHPSVADIQKLVKNDGSSMSYLERILASQAKRNKTKSIDGNDEYERTELPKMILNETPRSSGFDKETDSSVDENLGRLSPIGLSEVQNDDYIDDSLGRIEIPATRNGVKDSIKGFEANVSTDSILLQSVMDDATQIHNGFDRVDEKQLTDNEVQVPSDVRIIGSENANDNDNDYENDNENENDYESESESESESKINHFETNDDSSPQIENLQEPFKSDLDIPLSPEAPKSTSPSSSLPESDSSHEGSISPINTSIIGDHFTFNEGASAILDELEIENEETTSKPRKLSTISRGSGISTGSRKRSSDELLPISFIKNLFKNIQKSSGETSKKVLPNEVLQFIQEISDDFLLGVAQDLEQYASHRTHNKGSTININDVLLFLKRTNVIPRSTSNNGNEEINAISRLAHDFLPLELLVGLENAMQQGWPKRSKSNS